MKLFKVLAVIAIAAFSINAYAQAPQAAKKGIKITKITGTVNIMKDGQVLMTLKPGDAIPEITDNQVTFAIVDGTVEVEAGGKTISAATGSNFTVTNTPGQTNVSLGAGTPVAIRTESGNNIIMTANSEVKMVTANDKVQISMEKGNAVMTNASGGETQTVTAGQAVFVAAVPAIPATPAQPGVAPAVPATPAEPAQPADAPFFVPVVEPPPATVIPTQTVIENAEMSPSNP